MPDDKPPSAGTGAAGDNPGQASVSAGSPSAGLTDAIARATGQRATALPGTASGIIHSLRIYHRDADRMARMTALYRRFIQPGDIAFDIGAHVGDRTAAFLSLDATVVAVEPQPAAHRCLHLLYGRNTAATIVNAAVSDAPGQITLRVNTRNPTVSTASAALISAAQNAVGWEGQSWDSEITVPAVTLDSLIADHGRPAFIKIDVEGFEDRVLAGLSAPVPALSFEFTTIQRDVAHRCLGHLARLGGYSFNAALGETQTLVFAQAVTAAEIAAWLDALPPEANSGDIYAALLPVMVSNAFSAASRATE